MEYDKSRLSKDYTDYQWSFGEKAPKEDLEYLCVECALPLRVITEALNSKQTNVGRWLKFYNLRRPPVKVDAPEIPQEMLDQIDWSRLSKNYLEDKHRKTETFTKEELEYLYIELNWSVGDIAQLVGLSKAGVQKVINNMGIYKSKELHQESREKVSLRKYGTKHTIAMKETREKIENAFTEKYGVKSLLEKKEFREGKMMEKYGVTHPLQLKKFMDKQRETNLKNWGVEYTTQSRHIQEKMKKSTMENYGVDNVFKLPEMQEKARDTIEEKYGLRNVNQVHIKHLENMNKDFWMKHFYDKSISAFDTGACADYHNIGTSLVLRKVKEFEMDVRLKYESIKEHEIHQLIMNAGVKDTQRNRTVIPPKELDIYIPDKKLAIEFDGLLFHSNGLSNSTLDKFVPENYHLKKTEECQEKGVQLYHIFENEWDNPQQKAIWKSMILNKLGKSTRIYARNTECVTIRGAEARLFCMDNHLQGGCPSSVELALKYNGDIVAVMTFSKPRYNKNYDWELLRYCCKCGITVVGGASKLLSHFRRLHHGSIISYANLRWSEGKLYEKLGFTLINQSPPNYFYYKTRDGVYPGWRVVNLESRIKYQKHKLPSILEHFDPKLTEKENMYMNGYRTIYDCGSLVYALK